jgi:hypothetical protein
LVANQGQPLKIAPSLEDGVARLPEWLEELAAARSAPSYPAGLGIVVDLKIVADPATLSPFLQTCRHLISDCPFRSLAYGPHVHVELLSAAEAAGFDRVMTQGQFDRGFAAWLANPAT